MKLVRQKTDRKSRLSLPADFAKRLFTVERTGDELRVRKVEQMVARRYSFKEIVAGLTPKSIHPAVQTGPQSIGYAM